MRPVKSKCPVVKPYLENDSSNFNEPPALSNLKQQEVTKLYNILSDRDLKLIHPIIGNSQLDTENQTFS